MLKALIKSSSFLIRKVRDAQLFFGRDRLEPELKLLPMLVPADAIAVDVGANVGVYTPRSGISTWVATRPDQARGLDTGDRHAGFINNFVFIASPVPQPASA